jgi:hypothetical protein
LSSWAEPAAAVKCRHCGEIIDLALRSAEEAKAMAIRAQQAGAPIVNVNTNVVALAGVGTGPRKSRLGAWFLNMNKLIANAPPLAVQGGPNASSWMASRRYRLIRL